MRKIVLLSIMLVLILGCGGKPTGTVAARPKSSGPVLARVGDEVLTKNDLMILFRGQIPSDAPRDKLQSVLESWVNGEIWYQEAARLGVGQDETTRLALRNEERNLVARMLLGQVQDTVTVTDADVYDYFVAHKEDYTVSTSVVYMMLYDSLLGSTIAKRIRGGAEFSAVAKEFDPSQVIVGEPSPYFVRNDTTIPLLRLSPELNQAIFALKKGEVSDAVKANVEGKNTFWLFKCVDRRQVKSDVKFDEVKRLIAAELQPWKQQQVIEKVTEQFKQKAKVEITVDNFYGGKK